MPKEIAVVVLFEVIGIVILAFSPIGRALARRIGGDAAREHHLAEEVDELRSHLNGVQRQLDEAHERIDFAERMLGQAKARGRLDLPGGPTRDTPITPH